MSAKTNKHTCEKRLWSSSFTGPGHLHGVGANYEHEGQWYCKTHHPPTIAEKDNKQSRKSQAEWDAKTAARDKADALRKAEQRVLALVISLFCSTNIIQGASLSKLDEAARDLKALGWEPKS